MGERKVLYSPIIKSKSFGEPVSLDYEGFSIFFSLIKQTGWLEGTEVGFLPPLHRSLELVETGYFPFLE